jgi:putative ATP-binding cassette transporter
LPDLLLCLDAFQITVGLSALRDELDGTGYWADKLSGGEQQRLSIARALVQKPQWLFLDEATASLDEVAEAELYHLLIERLSESAIVSIGHRSSLIGFHDRFLELRPEAPGRSRLTEISRVDRSLTPEALDLLGRLTKISNAPKMMAV